MARRYTRDNRGRFASTGSGATARGGRLRTAAGNKRATQTMQSGAAPKGTIGKPKGLKPGAIKAKPQVSSVRQAATDRLKIKTETRRKLRADRASVIPNKSAGPKTMQAQRVSGTLPKSIARTKGNEPAKVAKRVNRKVVSTDKLLARNLQLRSKGMLIDGKKDVRLLKRSITLKKAQNYLATGKVARDNSIAAQRSLRQAKDRLAAKNAARRISRAQANLKRTADVRTGAAPGSKASFARRPSAKTTKSNLRAERALDFYKNPTKALREVNKKKPGFRMPRSMR